jgi:hypothetical protein
LKRIKPIIPEENLSQNFKQRDSAGIIKRIIEEYGGF